MNAENFNVLTNIIGAVESGGQVYGQRRYNAYAEPYANTPNEHTITLGWAQNYGPEAEKLIHLIYDTDEKVFSRLDTAQPAISSMLGKDWAGMRWNPNESQKEALIDLISSDTGKQCQDYLFINLMEQFTLDCERDYSKEISAQMMYCEIRHLGGKSAADRIFKRCAGDYSLENIMEALAADQRDTSSNNQVGDKLFWSRHQKCVEFINKYADFTDGKEGNAEMGITAEQIINKAKSYVGYREKNHASADLESFKDDAGSGNYQKFQPLAGAGNGDQWCQYFVDGVAVEVTGSITEAKKLLCQTNSGNYMTGYTPEGAQYFKNAGRWYSIPEPGDVVYFYTSSMGRICHVGYVASVNKAGKTFKTIEGNTNNDGFATNGGCVAQHEYSYTNVGIPNRVVGFGRPGYVAEENKVEEGVYMFTVSRVFYGTKGSSVLLCQEILKARGYKGEDGKELKLDGDCGSNTVYAINSYQSARRKQSVEIGTNGKNDGICGSGMWKDLLGL